MFGKSGEMRIQKLAMSLSAVVRVDQYFKLGYIDPHYCVILYSFFEIISLFFVFLGARNSLQLPRPSSASPSVQSYGSWVYVCLFRAGTLLTDMCETYNVEGDDHMPANQDGAQVCWVGNYWWYRSHFISVIFTFVIYHMRSDFWPLEWLFLVCFRDFQSFSVNRCWHKNNWSRKSLFILTCWTSGTCHMSTDIWNLPSCLLVRSL